MAPFTLSASPICILETIHVTKAPILILDASSQVNPVLMLHAILVSQLGVEHRFTVRAVPNEINLGCVVREILCTPREFAYRASLTLPFF